MSILFVISFDLKKDIHVKTKENRKHQKKYSLNSFFKEINRTDSIQKSHTMEFLEKGIIAVLLLYLLFVEIDYDISFEAIMVSVGINLILCNTYTYYNIKYSRNPMTLKILNSTYGYQNYEIKKYKIKKIMLENILISAIISFVIFSMNSIIYFIVLCSLSAFFMHILICFSNKMIPFSLNVSSSNSKEEDTGIAIIGIFAVVYECVLLIFGPKNILLFCLLGVSLILAIPFYDYLNSNQNELYNNFRQKKLYDCGLASLRNLLYYYEINMSNEEYKLELSEKKRAFSFYDIIEIGHKYGINLVGYECDNIGELALCNNPIIVLMKDILFNHFVVVYEMDEKNVVIGDPAYSKSRKMSIKRFYAHYQNKLLIREN